MLVRVVVVGVLACLGAAASAEPERPAVDETVVVDGAAAGRPFPHFWERTFGSGRAILSLRESYRRDLREVKRATGLEYVRFHAILSDEVGVYDDGRYNFSYVDQIYDGLLEQGVRPFVEVSFMPRRLAARNVVEHSFWYRPIVSPPASWDAWGALVAAFARHLVERYGLEEVSRWYFEVWNEPNIDFWAGHPKEQTYYRLYDVTAAALKSVSPRLRVGGPATAQAAWVGRFIRHCVDHAVPVDFVSTHVYANDTARDVFGTSARIPRTEMVGRAVRKVHDEVAASPRPRLPIVFSEYNASYKNEPEVTDSVYMGPWLADTIRQCDGLVDTLAYWTFSDVFEEQGVVRRPFYGGYGLIAAGGVTKPSFHAFALLHLLGTRRLASESRSALVTRRDDGTLVVAAWNLTPLGEQGRARTVTITLAGATRGRCALVHRVDEAHGSALPAYEAMGRPASPTRRQLYDLRRAARLPPPEERPMVDGTLRLVLPPHGLAVVEIR